MRGFFVSGFVQSHHFADFANMAPISLPVASIYKVAMCGLFLSLRFYLKRIEHEFSELSASGSNHKFIWRNLMASINRVRLYGSLKFNK